jgi:hypothetical protein
LDVKLFVGACEMRVGGWGLYYIPGHRDLSTICSDLGVSGSGECGFFFQRGRE